VLTLALAVKSQQPAPQQAASRFDVTNYRIEAQIIPDQHMLRAGADVTFVPLDATRSVVFELNGSLKVESIEKDGKDLTATFRTRRRRLARPSVRIDLGRCSRESAVHCDSLGRRTRLAGRRPARNQATGLRRLGRLIPDVCLPLVSFSRLRR
jgi:hypothetical protein